MQFKRLVVLLAALMALGVLVFLLRATRGADLDLDQHNARVAQMREMARLDAELDEAVRRSRLSLDTEARDLATAEQALLEAGRALSSADTGLLGFNSSVDEAFTAYAAAVRSKLAAVRLYATQQAQFVSAYQEFRKLGERALGEALSSQQVQLRQRVATLVSDLTTYSLQTAPTNGEQISQAIDALQRGAGSITDTPARQALQQLVQSAQATRAARDSMRTAADPIAQSGSAAALSALAATYATEHERRRAAPERYRLILVVYAGSLLLAFGLLGLRLRRSFGDLDSANAELQQTNANLESLVESRTVDLRKALEDLRLQQAQLIQSEKMASLGQMVAGVAHEINTPLGYARSNVGIVRDLLSGLRGQPGADESVEESDVLLADAEHGLQQIGELVMGLKNFSRVDRSRHEWFDVNEGLEASLKICQNQLKGRVEVERDFGTLPQIPCAPSQLNQVFLNIITNAAQAIDGPGTISIRTSEHQGGVRIVIRDSGCGMDEQTKAHIFEPFFTTKDVGHGTGLGLSIVYRIIEDHHGRIEVDSEPGRGTAFTITLPGATTTDASREKNNEVQTEPEEAVLA